MNRKKLLLVTSLLVMVISGIAYGQNSLRVLVNDNPLYSDVPPQIAQGRVLVPLRAVSEALDCEVAWDQATNTVSIKKELPSKTLILGHPKKVYDFWENTSTTPPFYGPSEVEQVVEEALEVLRNKSPEDYRAVCAYITSVVVLPDLGKDSDSRRDITARVWATGQLDLSLNVFEEHAAFYNRKEMADFYAIVVAHEAAHAQMISSGLHETLSEADQEVVACLCELRASERIGVVRSLTKDIKTRLEMYYQP